MGRVWWMLVVAVVFSISSATRAANLPTVAIQALVPTATENGHSNASFQVTRTGNLGLPLEVQYRVHGSALNGTDCVRLPGAVTIPAGQSAATIPVQPIDDTEEELPETLEVTLEPSTRPFRIVLLPDTQYYCNSRWIDLFEMQIRWIMANKDASNIVLVLHEGDCTDANNFDQWTYFTTAMRRLDGVVPYALAVGNHDGLGTAVNDTALFNQFFPLPDFQTRPSFGGVFEPNKLDNSFHFFSAGGVDWMVVSLEFGPRDEVLAWADQLIASHPERRVILLSHTHVYSDDTLHGTFPSHYWTPTSYGRTNNGTDVWEKLVRRHANISFFFNGHVLNDGAGRVIGTGDHGNKVYQMLANYQDFPNGGNAFLRIVEFQPAQDKFLVKSYSPFLDYFLDNPKQQFEYGQLGIFTPESTYQLDAAHATASVTITDDDRDTTPPHLSNVRASGIPAEVAILFDEPVAKAGAENIENYQISSALEIFDAKLQPDERTVILTLDTVLTNGGTYSLTVSNVSDRAASSNRIVNGSATFTYLRVLMADTFDDERMLDWMVVDEGTVDAPSNWKVRFGRLEQTANIYGPHSFAEDHREGTYVYWNRPDAFAWLNYTFAATVRSADDDGIGVLFRYRDPLNYCKLDLDRQRNFRKLFKVVDGQEMLLASEAGGYPQAADMLIHVELNGQQILVTLDGQPLFGGAVVDLNPAPGSIALYTWGSEGVSFDDVSVAPNNGTVLPPGPVDPNALAAFKIVTLVPLEAQWRFWPFDEPPENDWRELAFDDSSWPGPDAAIFAHEPDPLPEPRNTVLGLGPLTFYFRQHFTFPVRTNGVTLRLRHLLDDGAVFYLNGSELLRTGMPPGPIGPDTLAARDVNNAVYEGPFSLPFTNLFVGQNVFAVEVHQSTFFSEDVVFGAELEALVPEAGPPRFRFVRLLSSGRLQLSLAAEVGFSYRIDGSQDLRTWEPVTIRTNVPSTPVSIMLDTTNAPRQFYRAVLIP